MCDSESTTPSAFHVAHSRAVSLLPGGVRMASQLRGPVSPPADELLDGAGRPCSEGRGLYLSFLYVPCCVHREDSRNIPWLNKYITKAWEEIYRQKVKIITGLKKGKNPSFVGKQGICVATLGTWERKWMGHWARESSPGFLRSFPSYSHPLLLCCLRFAVQAFVLMFFAKPSSIALLGSAILGNYEHLFTLRLNINLDLFGDTTHWFQVITHIEKIQELGRGRWRTVIFFRSSNT